MTRGFYTRSDGRASWYPTLRQKQAKDGARIFVERIKFQRIGVRHPPALLVTDKFRHDEGILHPIRRSSFVVSHPSPETSEGWGTHFCGKNKIPKNWGAPPARIAGNGQVSP